MNLFIIRTTFQSYLVEMITKQNVIDKFIVIYISPSNNSQQRASFNRISRLSVKSYYILLGENKNKLINLITHIKILFELKKCLKFIKKTFFIKDIYVSSINSIFIQISVSKLNFDNLYTFDDGAANYNYNDDDFYNDDSNKSILEMISIIFGNKQTKKSLKKLSLMHYALLPNMKNIINNVRPLKITIDTNNINKHCKLDSCNVLIGTVYEAASNNPNKLLNDIEKNMDVDYYIPHPRLKDDNLFIDKRIDSEYTIAEIQIEKLLKRYNTINVFSFGSTVLINFRNIDRINLFLIKHDSINCDFYYKQMLNNIDNTIDIN